MYTHNGIRTVPALCGRSSRGIASALCIFDLGCVLSFWIRVNSVSDAMFTVSPVSGGGREVMVQGKQTQGVLELLGSLGVPRKWIGVSDVTDKKKK